MFSKCRSCCWCSVDKLGLTLCDLMNCSTPGFTVLHYLPDFAQTHVHWVSVAIYPSQSPILYHLTYTVGFFSGGLVAKSCPTLVMLWTVACQAHLSLGFFLQGTFPTQELNAGLLHCRQILYQLSYKVSSRTVIYLMHTTSFMWTSWVVVVVKNCPKKKKKNVLP